jgi:hypothetical protein
MPIQFENTFVNPNIQVKGTEIPLEQLEKTSNILQDRYDKSYENLTKFQVLAKQAEQIANPLEREKVKQYIASYQPAIDQMAKEDALHRVGWKTMAMANEAAGNLKMFQDRDTEIKSIKDKIAATDINDVQTRTYYQNMLDEAVKQTTFDPEKQSFNFQSINMPNVVKDYDYAKFLFGAGNDWKADTFGNSMKDVVVLNQDQVDANGNLIRKAGVYNKKDMSEVSQVKYNEVKNNILKALKGSPGAMEALDRDVNARMWGMGIDGKDPKNKELKDKIYDQVYKDKVLGVAEAVANKEAFTATKKANELDYDKETSYVWGVGAPQESELGGKSVRESEAFKAVESKPITDFLSNLKSTGFTSNVMSYAGSDAMIKKFQEDPKNKNIIKLAIRSLTNDSYLKELKQSNPNLYTKLTESKIADNQSTNIWDILNTVDKGKNLNGMQMGLLSDLLSNTNVALGSAYTVRNKDDVSFKKEMLSQYGDIVRTNGNYDPIKASKLLNHGLFENEEGLVLQKDKSNKFTNLNIGASKGLMMMHPVSGEIVPLKDYLQSIESELPDKTPITVTGKVDPGSLIHATSDNAYNSERNIAKAFGNAYTLDVNGKEIIVANPLDATSTNATISELAKFTRGIHPAENVDIWVSTPRGNVSGGKVSVESDGKKIHVVSPEHNVNEYMTKSEYESWISQNFKQRN